MKFTRNALVPYLLFQGLSLEVNCTSINQEKVSNLLGLQLHTGVPATVLDTVYTSDFFQIQETFLKLEGIHIKFLM